MINPVSKVWLGVHSRFPRLLARRYRPWLVLLVALWGTLILAEPLRAQQVQVLPTTARLGDTLTVMVDSPDNTPPQVFLNQKSYPSFAIAPQRYRSLLPTTPLDRPGTLNIRVNRGGDSSTMAVALQNRSFPTQRIWLQEKGGKLDEYEFDRVDAFKALVTPEKFWQGPLLRPNAGPTTTGYGVRRYYNGVFAKDYFHRGIDYAGPFNSAVVAPAAGRIALVGREAQRFNIHGNCVGIDHGQGVSSIMLHLNQIRVREGDFVQAGQVIGTLGSTGASTGPHLHWGLYVNGQSVDPTPWRTRGFD